MMRSGVTTLGVMAAGALLTLAPARSRAAERLHPDFTGRWQLNAEESEDARAKLAEARGRAGRPGGGGMGGPGGGGPAGGGMGGPGGGGMGPGGGGMGPGGGGTGGPGGRGSGGPRGEGGPPGGSAMRALVEAPQALTITGTDAEMTFDGGDGALLRIHVDGKSYDREGGELKTRAEWKDAALVVVTTPKQGEMKVTTTYVLRAEKRKLEVTSKLSGRTEVSVKRVYDAVAAGAEPTKR